MNNLNQILTDLAGYQFESKTLRGQHFESICEQINLVVFRGENQIMDDFPEFMFLHIPSDVDDADLHKFIYDWLDNQDLLREELENLNDGSEMGNALKFIANLCIYHKNRWHVSHNSTNHKWYTIHNFTRQELHKINRYFSTDNFIDSGSCKLVDNDGYIRMYSGQYNLKYGFDLNEDGLLNRIFNV